MARRRPKDIAEYSPQKGSPWTVIGPGCLIKGDLLMAGDIIIYGRIEGVLFTDGDVCVASGGAVYGGIHARRVVVEGRCQGRIEGLETTSLRAGARVHAEVITPALVVDPMARYIADGALSSRSPLPQVYPFRPRVDGEA